MKVLNDTSPDYMRGSLAKKFQRMSRARAMLNSASASLKRTRRSAEVGAFDDGRPPPLFWRFRQRTGFYESIRCPKPPTRRSSGKVMARQGMLLRNPTETNAFYMLAPARNEHLEGAFFVVHLFVELRARAALRSCICLQCWPRIVGG